MTTEELQWNTTFEQDDNSSCNSYNYKEELSEEARYEKNNSLFETLASSLRPY